MNFQHLPAPSDNLPLVRESGREVDAPYRGAGSEPGAASMRTMVLKYLSLAFKYKWLIAAFCAVALIGGFVNTLMTPKVYSAATTVKIDRVAPRVLNSQRESTDASLYDPNFYTTQYELIKSRSLAERVATSLRLAQTDFLDGGPPTFWQRLLGRTGKPAPVDAAAMPARHAAAVGAVQGGLSVQPVAMSNIVRIRFSSTSPQWAQRISIAAAEQYERSILDRRFGASKHARDFLDERLQQLKLKLQDSERQLIEYAQKEGIVNVDDKQPQAAANLQGVQGALAAAVTERLKLEQTWELAQRNNGASLPQVMTDPIIQAARTRLATLRATYQEKLSVLKPAFPEMVTLRAQMNEVEKQIRSQIDLIKESIKTEFDAAQAQEAALAQRLDEVKAEVLDLRGRSVDYTILMREVDTNRALYDGLLQQFRELSVAGDIDVNNVSIIDRAQAPGASDSPSLRKNLMISLLLGLMGAAGVIALREILDDTFKSAEDVEEFLNLPVLGVTPLFGDRYSDEATPIREVLEDFTSPMAEAYRSLRTALQFSTADGAPRSLLVTSSRPGEGKSTTSACLAANFAQLGMKVLLIDADLRNPSLHRQLATNNAAGLSNYLAGAADASALTVDCIIPGVAFMAAGPLPPNPAELLSGPRFPMLLTTASATFDIVIVDGPPVMALADSLIIASATTGTLLVVEANGPRRGVVRDALKRLDFARARMVGALLNKFDPRKTGFAYGYGYGYGYGSEYAYGVKNRVEQSGKPQLTEG